MISESEWKKFIEGLMVKGAASQDELKDAIFNAVKKQIPNKRFGIMFSGGIDSTFIAFVCKQARADFTCYAVGLKNSIDIIWAEKVAKQLGFKLKMRIIDLNEAEQIIRATAMLLNSTDAVRVGIGSVFYTAMQTARQDKIRYLFSGLGSEEIFAGYERHKKGDINAECWRGLFGMYQRDLLRDWKIAETFGIGLLIPFLDADVIRLGMQIPGNHKISRGFKKVILRRIAEDVGIPKEIVWRKKKAAQYGSGFDKALLRLAKRRGFKLKEDYLKFLLF